MRNVKCNVLSAADHLTTNGVQIDANQLVSASFHAYFGDATAAGTFKLQISNDLCAYGNLASDFTVTNWVDLPSQTASITSGGSALLTVPNMSYRWIRSVFASTATGVQHVLTSADSVGTPLNNTYFLLSAPNAGVNYYVWFNVSGGGTDPALPGKTAVPVAISTNDTADAVATATAAAIDALAAFVSTASTNNITVTNASSGPFIAATDGAVPTAFTFSITSGGTTTVNVNMNALSI